MPSRKPWLVVLFVVLACCLAPATASAAPITVDGVFDDTEAAADNGICTLREAITASNTDAAVDTCAAGSTGSLDTIGFTGMIITVTLDEEVASTEDANVEGDLDILGGTGGVTIGNAAGSDVGIRITGGSPPERVIDRFTGNGAVTLRNVAIRGGNTDSLGGGILNRSGTGPLEVVSSAVDQNSASSQGGGIFNQSAIGVIVDSTQVTFNTVSGVGSGAGISSAAGGLEVRNGSVIGSNQALAAGSSGGGISVGGGSLTVTDSTIGTNNAAEAFGGGISFLSNSALSITNSVITDNFTTGSATGGGGGIFVQNATSTTIDDSGILDNTAGPFSGVARPGGGIDYNASASALQVTDTLLDQNDSSGSGGAIAVRAGGLNLMRSVLTGNQVTGAPANENIRGGGISTTGTSTLAIDDSLFSGNSALANVAGTGQSEGGGLHVAGGGTATITQTTFSGNAVFAQASTPHRGGGLLIQSSANLTNVTVSGNTANGDGGAGGGLATSATPTVNVNNATFTANTAGFSSPPDGINETFTGFALRNTIVDDGCSSGPPDTDGGGNVVNGASCGVGPLNANPMLNPLRDNGGPAVGRPGDLRVIPVHDLDPSSPAVDLITANAGNCRDHVPADVTVDQRGLPRPFDGPDVDAVAECDSGAYELNEVCVGVGVTQADDMSDFHTGDLGGIPRRDVINGKGGDDNVSGGALDDVLCGEAGFDTFQGGTGDDRVDGGADPDTMNYLPLLVVGVNANLSTGVATGEGTDTLSTTENLMGSNQGDTLTGDNSLVTGNNIQGNNGDDVLAGGDGTGPDANDTLAGGGHGAGGDTVSYSTRNDAIGVNLGINTGGDLVGPEADTYGGIENATGGSAGDTLTGDNANGNVLSGLGGNDTLDGLLLADTLVLGAGANIVTSNDGVADTINCAGGGPNTGTVDTAPAENYVSCSVDGDAVVDFFDACPTQFGTQADGCPVPAVAPPAATPTTTAPAPVKKCKKGRKLKKGKCVKKKRKK